MVVDRNGNEIHVGDTIWWKTANSIQEGVVSIGKNGKGIVTLKDGIHQFRLRDIISAVTVKL